MTNIDKVKAVLEWIFQSWRTLMVDEVKVRCHVCGAEGKIRECELSTARITQRAHIDCLASGHAEYRPLSAQECRDLNVVWAQRGKDHGR